MTHRTFRLAALAAAAALYLAGCGTPATGNSAGNQAATSAAGNSALSNTADGGTPANAPSTGNEGAHTKIMQWSSPPPMQIDVNKQYDAVFHTNYGDFTVELFAKSAPHTVNNFVFLAEHKFYQNDAFFRIIRQFMIQTGDPLNNGTGGPGYTFADELPPKYPYGPGIVAMANAGPNTNGSQFFICTGPESTGLQPDYTEFGKVISGMDVVQKIAAIPVVANPVMGGEMSKPTKLAYIQSIDIEVK
ncbi:MAG: peptidylprolyl isomerase [Alicyclobacillus sp.]|nr:peptidylprolyl isomerase [Alicyclobacillus sp.]